MTLTATERATVLFWFYIFTPLVSATIGVVAFSSGFTDLVQKQMPAGMANYTTQAMNRAPIGWLMLTVACAFGTSLDWARRDGLKVPALVRRIVFFAPLIAVGQVLACMESVGAGYMLFNFIADARL